MATTESGKPLPVPDDASAPFFEATTRGKLLLQRCDACRAWMWPVHPRCVECFSPRVSWAEASGRATLFTFAVVHQLYDPSFADEIPYNVAVVELEEGVRMTTNVVGCAKDELRIGMPLEMTFERLSDEVAL